MVKAVYGKCEGYDIIFTRRGDTDLWDVDVPFERDGNYVVALYAIDYAGNEAYYATVLFTVKRFCISVKVLDINVDAGINLSIINDGVSFNCKAESNQDYIAQANESKFVIFAPALSDYYLHAVRCEKCGGV